MTTTIKRSATTITNAIDRIDAIEDIRAATELTEALIRDLEKRKRQLRAAAIDAGLAGYQVSQRESVPAKGDYIRIHGQAAFDQHKKVSDVKTFVWLD